MTYQITERDDLIDRLLESYREDLESIEDWDVADICTNVLGQPMTLKFKGEDWISRDFDREQAEDDLAEERAGWLAGLTDDQLRQMARDLNINEENQ